MLIRIKVNAIDSAGSCDRTGIKEMASKILGGEPDCRGQADSFGLRSRKFWGNAAFGFLNARRCYQQNRGDRHPRFNRCPANGGNDGGQSLGAMPDLEMMHRLKIICAKENDDQGQRRVYFYPLFEAI